MRIDELLKEAADNRASDLYLAAGAVPCMNCDGVYQPLAAAKGARCSPEQMDQFARQIMSEKQYHELTETLEANLAYMAEEAGRFRVNAFWQRGTIAMVFRRVIMNIPTMRSLSLPLVLRKVALADRGIVLVTGSTGSGKSTTLASMIDYRNHLLSGHIVTIEDPVEFVYRHKRSIVTQREVGIDTKSFHEALKNTLRQAPKVICIGEMRDAETVQFAMHASETGHLVFATLHSTSATLAIERILHFYPGEMKEQVQMQLALNLNAIICQRLVPRLGGGRVAAHEILLNTPRLQDLIGKGDISSIKMAIASENSDGLMNFERSLYKLCKNEKISQDEALMAAESANDLQIKFRGIGIPPNSSWTDLADPWENIIGDYDPPADSPLAQKIKDPSASGVYSNDIAAPLPTTRPMPPGMVAKPPMMNRPMGPPPPGGPPQGGPPPGGPRPPMPPPGMAPRPPMPNPIPPTGGPGGMPAPPPPRPSPPPGHPTPPQRFPSMPPPNAGQMGPPPPGRPPMPPPDRLRAPQPPSVDDEID